MGSDTFKRLMFALVIFSLFSLLIITFIVGIGNHYGKTADEIGSGSLNLTVFENSISDINQTSEDLRQSFEEGSVDDVDDARGVFSILNDMVTLVTTPFSLLSQVMTNLMGIPPIFTNILLGLLVISIILGIWSIIRKGD